MMAQDPSLSHPGMETAGEGNDASPGLSDTRDQQTDQGLTLQPKMQSSDPWVFDPSQLPNDVDLDALLGPVQYDLDIRENESQEDDSWLYDLFQVGDQLPEPQSKRRKLSKEPARESVHGAQPSTLQVPVESVSALCTFSNITKPFKQLEHSSSTIPGPPNPNGSSINLDAISVPSVGDEGQLDEFGLKSCEPVGGNRPVSIMPTCRNFAEVFQGQLPPYKGPQSLLTQDLTPASTPGSGHESDIAASNQHPQSLKQQREAGAESLPTPQTQDGETYFSMESGHAIGTDSYDMDDGSLFGDDPREWSSKEASLLEDSSSSSATDAPSSKASTPQTLQWDPNIPLKSVERDSPESESRCRKKVLNTTLPRYISKKAALEFGIQKSLFSLDKNQPTSTATPAVGLGSVNRIRTSNAEHEHDRNRQLPHPLAFSDLGSLLPLSLAFSIAQPAHLASILGTVLDAYNSATPSHQVPEQLAKLFDSLERKFNNDEKFRQSTFTYLAAKMASAGKSGILF